MSCLASFENTYVYTTHDFKRTLKAPFDHCFVIKVKQMASNSRLSLIRNHNCKHEIIPSFLGLCTAFSCERFGVEASEMPLCAGRTNYAEMGHVHTSWKGTVEFPLSVA